VFSSWFLKVFLLNLIGTGHVLSLQSPSIDFFLPHQKNLRNFYPTKIKVMKRIIVILVLIGGLAAVAFASLSSSSKKNQKQEIKKEKKKECKHVCPFS
jgi:hypothetical protein